MVQPFSDVLSSISLSALGRQMTLHELAHIRKRL
jgi:hypothetical protein